MWVPQSIFAVKCLRRRRSLHETTVPRQFSGWDKPSSLSLSLSLSLGGLTDDKSVLVTRSMRLLRLSCVIHQSMCAAQRYALYSRTFARLLLYDTRYGDRRARHARRSVAEEKNAWKPKRRRRQVAVNYTRLVDTGDQTGRLFRTHSCTSKCTKFYYSTPNLSRRYILDNYQ